MTAARPFLFRAGILPLFGILYLLVDDNGADDKGDRQAAPPAAGQTIAKMAAPS